MKSLFRIPMGIALVVATTNSALAAEMHIKDIFDHPWFWEVTAASGFGWFLGTIKGLSGSKEWLARYGFNPPKLLVLAIDFLVYVGVGGFFGVGIYNPETLHAALAAGMSWPLGLGALTTK